MRLPARRRADRHRCSAGDRRRQVGTAQQSRRRARDRGADRRLARRRPADRPRPPRFDRAALALPPRRAPATRSSPRRRRCAGETVIGKRAHSAFVGTALEAALDALGATTLVVCGALTHNSVEASVRATPPISAIASSSSPTPAGRSTCAIAAGRFGRPKIVHAPVARDSRRRIRRGGRYGPALAAARQARARERAKPEGRG